MSPSLPREKHATVCQQKHGGGNDSRVRANMAHEKLGMLRITYKYTTVDGAALLTSLSLFSHVLSHFKLIFWEGLEVAELRPQQQRLFRLADYRQNTFPFSRLSCSKESCIPKIVYPLGPHCQNMYLHNSAIFLLNFNHVSWAQADLQPSMEIIDFW